MSSATVSCHKCGTSIHFPGGMEVPEAVVCVACGADVPFASQLDAGQLANLQAEAAAGEDDVPAVCKTCDTRMLVNERYIGGEIACSMCGATVRVPKPKRREREVITPTGDVRLAPAEEMPAESETTGVVSPLSVWCSCGYRNRPNPEFAEREIRCLKCSASLMVPPILDSVNCPCGQPIAYTEQMQGRKQKCVACKQVLRLPAPPQASSVADTPDTPNEPIVASEAYAEVVPRPEQPEPTGPLAFLEKMNKQERQMLLSFAGVVGILIFLFVVSFGL